MGTAMLTIDNKHTRVPTLKECFNYFRIHHIRLIKHLAIGASFSKYKKMARWKIISVNYEVIIFLK